MTFPKFPIVVLSLACLFLYGCSQGETRVEEGNRLGIFHMGNGSDPQSLDPYVATDSSSSQIMWALHEGLVGINPYTLEADPGIAERWEVSEDGLTYRFYLNKDARWSNGEHISAEDVRWSFSRHLDPQMGNPWAFMLFPMVNAEKYLAGEIDDFDEVGFRIIDDHLIEIELSSPVPYFLQLLGHASSSIVPRKTIEEFGSYTAHYSKWTRAGNMVSAGPFRLLDYRVNRPVIVEKNPFYWNANQIELNEIHFYPTENSVTEERLFRSGQLHKTNTMPTDKIPVYQEQNPDALHLDPYYATYFYIVNTTRAPFDDPRIRRALAMAIDREGLNKRVMQGTATPTYSLVPPDPEGYQPPHFFEFDPEGARQLLAEAGFPNAEGFREFELTYNTLEGHRRIAVAIQQMWKEHLNLDVTLANQEWKVFLDTQKNLDYDIARSGWNGDFIDPVTFLELGFSNSGNNDTGFADDRYDHLYSEVLTTNDPDERQGKIYAAEEYLMEQMPFLPIYLYKTKYLVDPGVDGLPANMMNYINYRYISVGND